MALREYVTNNFWWKLLSLLLAAFTWLTIQTGFEREQNLRENPIVTSSKRSFSGVPITLLTAAGSTEVFRIDPSFVDVEVSGTDEELKKLQERDVHAYVDVSHAGDEKVFRRNILAQAPGDMKVSGVSRPYANVERIIVSRVP